MSVKVFNNHQKRIKQLNQSLSKKKKGSSRFKKVKQHLSKTHDALANFRKDFLHKESTKLIKSLTTDNLVVGDIQVNSIIQNKNSRKGLKKSFYNSALSMFKYFISYKGLKFDKAVHFVQENYTSKTCSCCGLVKYNLTLNDRIFKCVNCLTDIDRDVNAAINIGKVWLRQFKPVFI
jgi:putative transposase